MFARFRTLAVNLVLGTLLAVLERPAVQDRIVAMVERESIALLAALEEKQAESGVASMGLVNWAYVCATG